MSTSGGVAGGLRTAVRHVTAAELATVGSLPLELAPGSLPPNAGNAVDRCVAQVASLFSSFDFSGGALIVTDDQGDVYLTFTTAVWTLETVELRAAAGLVSTRTKMYGRQVTLTTVGGVNPGVTGRPQVIAVANGGAGYAPGDTGRINGGNNNSLYQVATVGALGVVTGVTLVQNGSLYDTTHNPHATTNQGAQPGVGVGLTINITALLPIVADFWVTTFYSRFDLH